MKYKIEIAPLADHYVVVASDMETGKLKEAFTLNESATNMLKLFCRGLDVDAVSQKIAKIYDAPLSIVQQDVKAFADKLLEKGLM